MRLEQLVEPTRSRVFLWQWSRVGGRQACGICWHLLGGESHVIGLTGFKARLESLDYSPCLVRERFKSLALALESSSLTTHWVYVYMFCIWGYLQIGTYNLKIIGPRIDPWGQITSLKPFETHPNPKIEYISPLSFSGGRGFKPQPDQHSGSLNNWGESAAFVIISANG